jgi:hypothetical protein
MPMNLRMTGWLLLLLLAPLWCAASAAERPKPDVVALLEDNGEELLPKLTNPTGCPGEGHVDKEEKFSGESGVRIVPMQRFEPAIPGWNFRITENPKKDEYRYLRFAWKSRGCSGIMLQLHDEKDWNIRQTAGVDKYGWGTKYVAEKPPEKWTLITIDLFKDFGERTIRGMALTCFDGEAGYFDHIYLGRSVDDLDRIDATGLADQPPREWTAGELEARWGEVLSADDAPAAYRSFWALAAAKPAVPFLAEKLKSLQKTAGVATIKKWIAELDDDDFATREKASESLGKITGVAKDLLEAELAKTESAEMKFRLKNLLSKEAIGDPQTAQLAKAIRILEMSLAAEAKETLSELARGDEADRITKAAQAALTRLEKRARP